MPDEDISGETGTPAGVSTDLGADTAAAQISEPPVVEAPAVAADDDAPAVVEKDEDEMTLEELADKAAAERLENAAPEDKPAKVELTDAEKATAEAEATAAAEAEARLPKNIKDARAHITSLETQLTPLRTMEAAVQEMGGMQTLEATKPLFDAVMNPEATAAQIFEALAEAAPHHDVQSLAWSLLEGDDNQAAAINHFFGDDVTPEILGQLVDKFKDGKIDLDNPDDADTEADDIFLTAAEKAERATKKDTATQNAEATKTKRDAQEAAFAEARTTASTYVSAALERSVNESIRDFAIDEKNDTPEMKELKGTLTQAVHAMTMVELSTNPTFRRVQALIQKNGGKVAQNLTDGALTRMVGDRSAAIMKILQPLFVGGVAGLQKQAKTITGARKEPTGALGQTDATRAKEISAKDPHWRKDLDAEFEGKVRDLQTKAARNDRGQFA